MLSLVDCELILLSGGKSHKILEKFSFHELVKKNFLPASVFKGAYGNICGHVGYWEKALQPKDQDTRLPITET